MTIDSVEIFIILGTALAISLIAFIIIVVILYRRSQLEFQLERQAMHQALLQTEVEIREQTLKNISRDLHDNLGQIASLIKINLTLLSKNLEEKDQQHIDESKDLLKNLIGDIRALSSSLSNETLAKQGLVKMIESDLDRVRRSGALKIIFDNRYENQNLPPNSAIFLYRMFQELLNNTLKHAQADTFTLMLEGEGPQIRLVAKDNGVGIPAEKLKDPERGLSGNGLINLKERCEMIGASYDFQSAANQGTRVSIQLKKQI